MTGALDALASAVGDRDPTRAGLAALAAIEQARLDLQLCHRGSGGLAWTRFLHPDRLALRSVGRRGAACRPVDPVVGRDGTGGRRAGPVRPDPGSLAPPWATAGAAVAVLVTGILGGLVWHSTRLPGPDAWGLHLLGAHTERQFRLATELAAGLRALTVGGIVATTLIAWMALRRWNAVALAVLAPAATLAAEKLLKPLVARQAEASPVFQYPSGHVAVATALALSLVLIVRSSRARPGVRTVAVICSGLLVLLMAGARMVETAHVLSDVVGGAAAGVAVTLVAALILDQRRISCS